MIFQNIRNRDEHTIYYACIILCVRNFTAFSNKLTSFYGYSYTDKLQYFFVTTSSSKQTGTEWVFLEIFCEVIQWFLLFVLFVQRWGYFFGKSRKSIQCNVTKNFTEILIECQSASKKYEKLDSIVLANAMAPRDNKVGSPPHHDVCTSPTTYSTD